MNSPIIAATSRLKRNEIVPDDFKMKTPLLTGRTVDVEGINYENIEI